MNTFHLLRPEEVLAQWQSIAALLQPAVDMGNGEMGVEHIRKMVIAGQMFVFATDTFVCVVNFCEQPNYTALNISYASGDIVDYEHVFKTISAFAKLGGADRLQTYCKNPAMIRYYRRHFQFDPVYTMLEKQL